MSTDAVSLAVNASTVAVAVLTTVLATGVVAIPFGPRSLFGELCWSGTATEPKPAGPKVEALTTTV